MKLHAIVSELFVAEQAASQGATVLQLRLKGVATDEVVRRGAAFRKVALRAGIPLVVNDDVEAALALGADGIHLGRTDAGAERALAARLMLGLSAWDVEEAAEAERRGAAYVGAGPVWATPSKADADPPIGLEGLARICSAVSVPVVAIGGIDAANAADCLAAGAAGVAVIRAAADVRPLLRALERAAV
jgi:thiamine-phosphate pyrophosphorylase